MTDRETRRITQETRNAWGRTTAQEEMEVTGYVSPWGTFVEVTARPAAEADRDRERETYLREALRREYVRRWPDGSGAAPRYVELTAKQLRERAIQSGGGMTEYLDLLEQRLESDQRSRSTR